LLTSKRVFAVSVGLAVALWVLAVGTFEGGGEPARIIARSGWTDSLTRRTPRFGFAGWRLYRLSSGLALGLALGLAVWFAVGPVPGLLFGLLPVIVFGLAQPATGDGSPSDPLTVWRADRNYGLVVGLLAGLTVGVMFLLVGELSAGLVAGCACALTFGMISSETAPLALAGLQLRCTAGTPVRLMRFLEDAHRRGVLRTVGAIYQFRHARLHDRLSQPAPM